MRSWPLDLFEPGAPERVGLVLADDSVIELFNIHPAPTKGFMVEVGHLLPHLEQAVATWHTHPRGDATPSVEDLGFFRRWPSLTHLILCPAGEREYEVEEGEVLCK